MKRLLNLLLACCILLPCLSAGQAGDRTPTEDGVRSWAMGFGLVPPRPSVPAAVRLIDTMSARAEIAAIHEELPWAELLAGTSVDTILDRDKADLIRYLRSKGLKIYLMADPNDGLSRGEEAPRLRALGRRLAEPDVQAAYRRYVTAFVRRFQPEFVGLAAETNLVRRLAPASLYGAIRRVAAETAAELRAQGSTARLLSSVQVETAWGRLAAGGAYAGIEQDFADFAFADMLGLSAYPYLGGFAEPESIPDNYFSRLLNGRRIPVMIVEGGWSSAGAEPIRATPALQARWLARQAQLADSVGADALIQLLFADLDLDSFPGPRPANLPLFIHVGLTDADFHGKPALYEWDRLHRRKLVR
jgi:hypothetical protein